MMNCKRVLWTGGVNTLEGPYRFDSAYGKTDRVRFEKDIENSRLVVIGEGLEAEGIRRELLLLAGGDISR